RLIPDRQSLVIYAQTDPVPIDEALAPDRHATATAAQQDRAGGEPALAQARERLLTVTTQTVIAAAGAEQPAVATRWWVAVPYQPDAREPRDRARALAARARGKTTWSVHRTAAVESLSLASNVQGALAGAGIESTLLAGVQVLAVLWERLHPAEGRLPDFGALEDACALTGAATLEQAAAARHRVITAVCDGASIDAGESPSYLRHG